MIAIRGADFTIYPRVAIYTRPAHEDKINKRSVSYKTVYVYRNPIEVLTFVSSTSANNLTPNPTFLTPLQ